MTVSLSNRLTEVQARVRLEPEPLTDDEVVERVLRGDRESFRVLVQRYQDTLYRHALSMVRDEDTAADLVQATFINAFVQLHTLRDGASFGGWVYRMCANRCRDELKSARGRGVSLEAAPPLALHAPGNASDGIERQELRQAMADALAELPVEQREAFIMKHVEERTYDEMSEVLDASVPALKMRVHRAREALQRALQGVA